MTVLGATACKADWTLLVDPIRASSLYRLHKQAEQTTAPDQRPVHHFMLATREPPTEDCALCKSYDTKTVMVCPPKSTPMKAPASSYS
jgi:hypothetical protein